MMECIVRLYKLNMLPESILLMEAEDPESARRRMPRPSNKARNSSAGSMLSRAFSRYNLLCFASVSKEKNRKERFTLFSHHAECQVDCIFAETVGGWLCSLISLEGPNSGPPREGSAREMKATQRTVSSTCSSSVNHIFVETSGVLLCSLISLEGADSGPPGEGSAREVEATQRTVSCMSACRVEDIFADSKFLRAESLHELVKAIMWASGPIKRMASSGEESDTAQVISLSACMHRS